MLYSMYFFNVSLRSSNDEQMHSGIYVIQIVCVAFTSICKLNTFCSPIQFLHSAYAWRFQLYALHAIHWRSTRVPHHPNRSPSAPRLIPRMKSEHPLLARVKKPEPPTSPHNHRTEPNHIYERVLHNSQPQCEYFWASAKSGVSVSSCLEATGDLP